MAEELAPELPPWNEATAGSKLGKYTLKPGRELDVLGIRVAELVNHRFAAAVDNRNYLILKKSSRYDDHVAHEYQKMAKNIAVQMKDHTFSGNDAMSIVAFLQEFNSTFNACGIHENGAVWLFKQYIADPAEEAVKARDMLTNSAKFTARAH